MPHPASHLESRQHLVNAALELLARVRGDEAEDRHSAPRFNVGGDLVDYRLRRSAGDPSLGALARDHASAVVRAEERGRLLERSVFVFVDVNHHVQRSVKAREIAAKLIGVAPDRVEPLAEGVHGRPVGLPAIGMGCNALEDPVERFRFDGRRRRVDGEMDRHRFLDRLGLQIDIGELVILARMAELAIAPKPPQDLDALDHAAGAFARGNPHVRTAVTN